MLYWSRFALVVAVRASQVFLPLSYAGETFSGEAYHYEDDGDTQGHLRGEYQWTRMSYTLTDDSLEFKVRAERPARVRVPPCDLWPTFLTLVPRYPLLGVDTVCIVVWCGGGFIVACFPGPCCCGYSPVGVPLTVVHHSPASVCAAYLGVCERPRGVVLAVFVSERQGTSLLGRFVRVPSALHDLHATPTVCVLDMVIVVFNDVVGAVFMCFLWTCELGGRDRLVQTRGITMVRRRPWW